MRTRNVALAILALLLLLTVFKPHEAARILDEEEEELMKRELQSLQRAPVNPSGPDSGTYTPASTTLGQKGFAGQAKPLPTPPAYPQHTVQFGVATN